MEACYNQINIEMNFVSFLQEDSTSTCTKALITAQVDQCAYVKTACAEESEYLDFLAFYYCSIDQNVPLIILICAVFVVVAFQFLGTTADNFLSESLEVVAAKLKISDAVAAVTFLALANGAADVITGIVAGGKGSSGVYIAMGGLFGAALFTVTVVFARCIQGDYDSKKKDMKEGQVYEGFNVEPKVFVRDVSFILMAGVYFYIIASVTTFTFLLVCVYLVIYVLYFIVVFYQISQDNKREKEAREKKDYGALGDESERQPIVPTEKAKSHHDLEVLHIKDPDAKSAIDKIKRAVDERLQKEDPEGYKLRKAARKPTVAHALWQYVYLNTYYSQKLQAKRAIRRARAHKGTIEEEPLGEEGRVGSEQSEDEYGDNLWGRFMFRYDQVLLFIRQLTIPQFNEKEYSHWMALAPPIFGTFFLCWTFGIIPPGKTWVWWIVLGIAGGLELLHIIFFRVNFAKRFGAIQGLVAFLVSAMWIDLVATCFMDMLALITVISGLPLTYLSLTMLAWGNSMDDYFIDYVVSKKGKGPMAVTGVFAGQFFNLLLGFGGGMFRLTLQSSIDFNFYTGGSDNVLNIFLLVSFIFVLILTLVVAWSNKFKLGKNMMYFLMAYYVIFLIVATIIVAL